MTQHPDEKTAGKKLGRLLLPILAAAAVAFLLGFLLARQGNAPQPPLPAAQEGHESHEGHATVWTCSMHPQIRLPKPGKCPICFMDLIPVESGPDQAGGENSARSITLTPQAIALAEVRTAPVVRRELGRDTRMTGSVEYDERRLALITAWVPGRIDRLYVDYTGAPVGKGEALALLYSPELVAAQAELLQAARAFRDAQATSFASVRDAAGRTLASAREKLRLLGLGADQVKKIEQGGEAQTHVAVRSPIAGTVISRKVLEGMYVKTGEPVFEVADLSRVWVVLAAYESDLPWVGLGDTVRFTAEALPGEAFSGKVVYVDPVVDTASRTIRMRLDADNGKGLLKPGMFVRAEMKAPAEAAPAGTLPLAVPDTAPLLTGKRAVVYVETGPGAYEGREVELGPRAAGFYAVKSGLSEGEKVVVNGAFKIDSAMQILARPSMMSPGGGGPAPGMANMPGMKMDGGSGPGESPAVQSTDTGGADRGQAGTMQGTATSGEKAGAGGGNAFAALEAPPAFRQSLGRVYAAYRPLTEALSADDPAKARDAAKEVSDSLAAVDMALLSGESHAEWMKDLATMQKGLAAIDKAADIQGLRAGFHDVSRGLIAAMSSLGYQGGGPVYELFCPMAFDNKGATWLSHDKTVRNPYYGAAMYGCGEVKRSIDQK